MSDPVSALNGASHEGLVTIQDRGPVGMITLRGDLSSPPMAKAVDTALGLPIPPKGRIQPAKGVSQGQAAWMSPDEILLILPYGQVRAALKSLENTLAGQHYLAEDLSDARSLMTVTGPDPRVREVLAKLSPVDLHPSVFGPGDFRRSRLAQVAGAFWMPATGQINVVCFRSVATYVYDIMCNASDPSAAVDFFH